MHFKNRPPEMIAENTKENVCFVKPRKQIGNKKQNTQNRNDLGGFTFPHKQTLLHKKLE